MTRDLSLGAAIVVLVLCCTFAYAADTLTFSLETPALGGAGATGSSTSEAATGTSAAGPKSVSSTGKTTPKSDGVKVGHVGVVQVSSAPIYRTKSTAGRKYSTVKAETPLAIIKEEGEWYGVLMSNRRVGWIQRQNVRLIGYDLVARSPERSRSSSASRGGIVSRMGEIASDIIRTAQQYTGVKYVFGGTSPSTGMDCSAFVRSVFSQHGVDLPRTAREQAQVGTAVPFDQLQPGDRLYFACRNPSIDHCGIYAGNGYFVHCSASRHGVGVDSLTSGFYSRSLVAARRS